MKRPTAASLLIVLVALSGYASRGEGEGEGVDQTKAGRAAAIDRLTARGTADSLATSALLKQFGAEADDGSYALVARAVELAPGRADLTWLAVRLCNIATDCDPAVAEQHLRAVDQGNGVASMGALIRAQAKSDAAAVDTALTALGNSERFYVYFDPLVAATAPELARARYRGPGPPSGKELTRATVEMIGIIAASVLPSSQAFSSACKGMALQLDGRLERCQRAAQAFERADTFLVEGLGLSLQQRLWPLDSTEGRAVTARRRELQYRLEEYSRLGISASNFAEVPTDLVDVLRTHAREQDAALVYFAKAGIPADPPANWTSTILPRVP